LICSQSGESQRPNADEIATEAIEELNARFKKHGVGYVFTDGRIIRVDAELVHAEIVKPALGILRQKIFCKRAIRVSPPHMNIIGWARIRKGLLNVIRPLKVQRR
jgi:AbiJ N-terminal domain 4